MVWFRGICSSPPCPMSLPELRRNSLCRTRLRRGAPTGITHDGRRCRRTGCRGPTLEERCEAVRAVIMAGPCAWLQESIDDASIWFADGRLGDWALLVDRVAGVGVLHRVPRDCRRLFACSR